MRTNLFFAVELSEEARSAVSEGAALWKAAVPDAEARWYSAEDYHITLKFLGAHEPCEIDAFAGQVGRVVADAWNNERLGSIPFTILGAGAFPSLRSPRVLWAGVKESRELSELAMRVDEACAKLSIPADERAYKPHVTLARIRARRGTVRTFEPPEVVLESARGYVAWRFALMQTSLPADLKIGARLRYNTVHTFDIEHVAAGWQANAKSETE